MRRLLVIGNVQAGSSDEADLERAVAVLEKSASVELARTSSPDSLGALLSRRGDRTVVVAGGDGSLHAVVACLHSRGELAETALGLIPLGTGNDFARGAGVPLQPDAAAALVVDGTPRSLDLVLDDAGGVVVNAVHVGAGAEASRRARPWKRLGRVAYAVGAGVAGLNPPTLQLRVTVDGHVVSERSTLQVAVGNAPYVGGGTELTPEAHPGDGKADVLVSFATGPLARVGYLVGLRRGEHHERHDVLYLRGTTVTVEGEPFYASADGEVQGPLSRRAWRVEPGALTMLLPRSTAARAGRPCPA